jgi:hypothetical protein
MLLVVLLWSLASLIPTLTPLSPPLVWRSCNHELKTSLLLKPTLIRPYTRFLTSQFFFFVISPQFSKTFKKKFYLIFSIQSLTDTLFNVFFSPCSVATVVLRIFSLLSIPFSSSFRDYRIFSLCRFYPIWNLQLLWVKKLKLVVSVAWKLLFSFSLSRHC